MLLLAFSPITNIHLNIAEAGTYPLIDAEIAKMVTVAGMMDASDKLEVVARYRTAVTAAEATMTDLEVKAKVLELLGLTTLYLSDAQVAEMAVAGLALVPSLGLDPTDTATVIGLLELIDTEAEVAVGLPTIIGTVSFADEADIADAAFRLFTFATLSDSNMVTLGESVWGLVLLNYAGLTALVDTLSAPHATDVLAGLVFFSSLYLSDIGNRVWIDTNENGLLEDGTNSSTDLGEAGLDGITVELLDSTGATVLDTTTSYYADPAIGGNGLHGYYHFYRLMPGDYKVRIVPPSGKHLTPQSSTLSTDNNSDFDQVVYTTDTVTLGVVESLNYIDAGLYTPVAPTAITLDSQDVDEAQPAGTLVGNLSTTDANTSETHTYAFTCAIPGTNDDSFQISGTELQSDEMFDYETKDSYDICVKTTDTAGLEFEENLTITVNNIDLSIISAITGDTDNDGQIDAVAVNFNMDLNGSTVNPTGTDFSVIGYTIASASEVSPGVVHIILDESGAIDSAATPEVSIISTITSTASTGSEIITSAVITPSDGVNPVVAEVTAVPTPSMNASPAYTFSSSEDGTFVLGGSCNTTSPLTVTSGNNPIVFNAPEGIYSDCTITVSDLAGNIAPAINVTPFTVDTTAPNVALSYSVDPAMAGSTTVTATYDESVSSAPTISIDQQGTTDITGTTMAGTVPGTVFTYDYTVNTHDGSAYIDGAATVSLSSVADIAGNTASAPTNTTFTIDTTAPAAPSSIPDLLPTADLGDSDDDNNTSERTTSYSMATCTTGNTVNLYIASTLRGSAACTTGSLASIVSSTISLVGNYDYQVTFTETDPAGNESAKSVGLPVHFDFVAPDAPVATTIDTDTGVSSTDNITSDNALMYNGTMETGVSAVELFLDGSSIGDAILNTGSLIWALDKSGTTLTDAIYALTTQATDVAGNVSSVSSTTSITIDTQAPVVSSITTDTNPIFMGDLTQEVVITYSEPMDTTDTPVITFGTSTNFTAGAGVWSAGDTVYTITYTHDATAEEVALETISLAAGLKDKAGNTETTGATSSFGIDTELPLAPTTVPDMLAAGDSGVSDTDNITSNNTPEFKVACSTAGDTATLYAGSLAIGTGLCVVDGTGYSASITPAILADGTPDITYTQKDMVGNETVKSPVLQVTIDTTNPSVTIEKTTTQNDPTNVSPIVFTVTFNESIVTSTLEYNDFALFLIGGATLSGNSTLTEVAPNDGTTFEFSMPVATDGDVGTSLMPNKTEDLAGNINNISTSSDPTVTYDTIAPTAPAITDPTTGTSVGGMPTVSGTADANMTVTVKEGVNTLCTATADAAGDWSCTVATSLVEADYTVKAIATDSAGNVSAESTTLVMSVRGFTVNPTALTINEGGGTGTFNVVLDTQPVSDVVLTVVSSATGEAIVDSATLTFTNANWNLGQTVTVTGIDDSLYTTDSATITVSVDDTASDVSFSAFLDETVTVTLTNNDSAGGGGIFRGSFGGSAAAAAPAPAPTGSVLGVDTFRFNFDMSISTNTRLAPDVTELQNRLTAEGYYDGPITGFFGPLTRAAAVRYQEANEITPAVGFVGPITRGVLNDSETPAGAGLTQAERDAIQAQIDELLVLIQTLMEELGDL